jgi:hypothetical protein
MTCFEGTSGPPAKQVTACEARATTAKATTFFIMLGSHFSLIDRDSTIISTTRRAEGTTPDRGRYMARGIISGRTFLWDLSRIDKRWPR